MGSGQINAVAVITFGSAGDAERKVAGVAAAARIVREVSAAGLAGARLVLPAGGGLGRAALADVRRLAGPVKIEIAASDAADETGDNDGKVVHLPGNWLIPARQIIEMVAGGPGCGASESLSLNNPGAAAEILRNTGKIGDGPVSRWLNRPISRRLSALLLHVPGIRPVHATAGTALLALLMFGALVGGGPGGLLAGAVLFQAASIFDGVDGELARATFRTTQAGAVLDSIVDVATNVLFLLGVTLNVAQQGEALAAPLAAWGFALFVLGLAPIAWRASRSCGPFSLDMVKHHYRQRFPGPPIGWLISLATIVSSRDFFALLFALLIMVGWPMAVLYIFAATATVWILFVAGSILLPQDPVLASPGA